MMGVDQAQIEKAVKALSQYIQKQKEEASSTEASADPFEDAAQFWLQIGFKKTPPKQAKPVQITIPNSLFVTDATEICLFTKDPQSDFDKLTEKANIDGLKKVISAQTLRKEYKTYEAKRNLCDSYDLFLADARVLPSLTKHLGSKFFENKKQPMPIKFQDTVASLSKAVEKSKRATFIRYNGGPCSTLNVGHGDLSQSEVVANVVAALAAVGDKVHGGWKNIQSAHLKTGTSIALPIYQSLASAAAEGTSAGETRKGKRSADKDGDAASKVPKRHKEDTAASEGKLGKKQKKSKTTKA